MKYSKLLLSILLAFHAFLILKGGYFLSPEFTIYPYFAKMGLLPYMNIIDQHLPFLLFGPIALPSILTTNPLPLLPLFLLTLLVTDLLFYLSLIRFEVKHPLLVTALFVLVSYYYQGNFLWYDTYISFFLVIILILVKSKTDLVKLVVGVFLALIFLTKPTLLPSLVLLVIYLKLKPNRYLLTGFLLPLAIVGLYLSRYDLHSYFYQLVVVFNRDYYLKLAYQYPTIRQAIEVLLVSILPLWLLLKNRQIIATLLCLSFLILAYPRFEYVHLQPFLIMLIFVTVRTKISPKIYMALAPVFVIAALLMSAKAMHKNHGNYYLTPDLVPLIQYLQESKDNTIYLLGVNDLLYSLSGKLPPSQTYIPSLHWYLGQDVFQYSQAQALSRSKQTRIIVKSSDVINGKAVIGADSYLWKYIMNNYQKLGTISGFDIYESNLFFEEIDKI